MESRYKVLGHPIHPMLIPFPLALLATAAIFDVVGLVTADGTFHTISFWMIAAGLLVALAAALFGLLDFLKIADRTRAKRVALMHGLGNVVVVILFAASWWLRLGHLDDPGLFPVALAIAGALLLAVTGWLGGELPYRLGIGIDEGANPNASSSLSDEPLRAGDRAVRT
jgi:uncharacterized membrane protein